MKILVLNGSPHLNGSTSDMVNAFAQGAKEAGHEVEIINVAHKNIHGCMACEYCREKELGICCQKDDMQSIYPEILSSDMVVFASPIYYFTLSAQLQAAIHRTYSIDIPKNIRRSLRILRKNSLRNMTRFSSASRYGGMICRCRCGPSWKAMILPARRSSPSFLMRAHPMEEALFRT